MNQITIEMSEPSCSKQHLDIIECRRILTMIQPECLTTYKSRNYTEDALRQLRILARSKSLNDCFDLSSIEILVCLAKDRYLEAQMCLHNIILNYPTSREFCIEPYIDCFTSRQFDECSQEILNFDLKILFLLSALNPSSRKRILDKTYDTLLKLISKTEFSDLSAQETLCEILKVLFNLTIEQPLPEVPLYEILIKLLSHFDFDSKKNDGVFVDTVHLLTNLPHGIYNLFTEEISDKMLHFLNSRLSICNNCDIRENLLPILTCCVTMCRSNRKIRYHWKDKILPKNTNYATRPELNDSIRGNLVRLMTSVDTEIKEATALLIFILCKENVNRFIKYTGFGNAAGFLANRGLMQLEESKIRQNIPTQVYSSDSDTSDSEEYLSNLNKINPVTGAYQIPGQDPMDGMSEEQKEHHAVELAKLINTLSEGGIIKPMGIGKDGNIEEISPANFIQKRREADDETSE